MLQKLQVLGDVLQLSDNFKLRIQWFLNLLIFNNDIFCTCRKIFKSIHPIYFGIWDTRSDSRRLIWIWIRWNGWIKCNQPSFSVLGWFCYCCFWMPCCLIVASSGLPKVDIVVVVFLEVKKMAPFLDGQTIATWGETRWHCVAKWMWAWKCVFIAYAKCCSWLWIIQDSRVEPLQQNQRAPRRDLPQKARSESGSASPGCS